MKPIFLFDFDGVIADTQTLFHESFRKACAAHGFCQFDSTEAFLTLFDMNMYEGMAMAGIPVSVIPAILKTLAEELGLSLQKASPFNSIPAVLADLVARAPVYIITSNISPVVEAFLKRHNIRSIADVLGSDKGLSKVEKIKATIALYPAKKQKFYYIGDTAGDMLEGRKGGAIPVAAAWGWHSEERLRSVNPSHVLFAPKGLLSLNV